MNQIQHPKKKKLNVCVHSLSYVDAVLQFNYSITIFDKNPNRQNLEKQWRSDDRIYQNIKMLFPKQKIREKGERASFIFLYYACSKSKEKSDLF